MKKTALICFLWSKNLSVLENYLNNHQRKVVVTLHCYATPEMRKVVESTGNELIILESFFTETDSQYLSTMLNNLKGFLSHESGSWHSYCQTLDADNHLLEPVIIKSVDNCLHSAFKVARCLDKVKENFFIELLVVNEEWLVIGRCAAQWAKIHRIPCLHVLHGLALNSYNMIHNQVISDAFAVYGEREIENLKNIGVPLDRIHITGGPSWDSYHSLRNQRISIRNYIYQKYHLNNKLPLIVFGTTWEDYGSAAIDPDDLAFQPYGCYARTLYLFFKACGDLQQSGKLANFLVKDHPFNILHASYNSLDQIKNLANRSGFSNEFFYAIEDGVELIIAADIVIATSSNLLVEAMIAGTPAINVLYDTPLRSGPNFDVYSGVLEIEPDRLSTAIISILDNHEFRQKLLELMCNKADYYHVNDGKASLRVAQLMAEMALNRSQFDYQIWHQRHSWPASMVDRIDNQITQSRISISWHLLLIDNADNDNLLNDTLASLNRQSLSKWRLTVFSHRNPYKMALSKKLQDRVNWIRGNAINGDLVQTIDVAIAEVNADWLMIAYPGFNLELIFTTLVCAKAMHHPEWRFIYTDEDSIDSFGQYTKPLLKPDANLDLLRSSGYIGYACLIHQELWKHIRHEFSKPGLLLNYGAALYCYEIFGEKAIGHIDEIIFHQHADFIDDFKEFEQFGLRMLRESLQRQDIQATVNPGLLEGSFFVDYALARTPLVSIIIPTKDRLDLLEPCIESLLAKTRYPHYEIIIIDNQSVQPETLAYFDQLPIIRNKIKVLHYSKKYNYSAINNFAVQHAQGDFLLLLNNDTLVLQDNWLNRMVAIGLRSDVGAVGCRLVYTNQVIQHAGIIIGLCGVAEHIGIGSKMNDSGYMGRNQLTQNFSAVTAACMLVRKGLFFEVGGLDENDFAVLYNDVDLCMKLCERGYRIVWTPFVTLIHHGNSSLNAEPDAQRNEENLNSRRVFIKKWYSRLGNDPAYNRHLSLRQREWTIDGNFDVAWHPELEPLPRIIAQAPDEMGVGQYRIISPINALTHAGKICSFVVPPLTSENPFLPYVSELARVKPTVLFLQNAFTHFHLEDLQTYAQSMPEVFRVFGQDDIVFSVPQKSAVRKNFGKDTKARVRKAVSLCHRAVVTTQPIAEAMRGMVNDIRVVPNYLERSRWNNLHPPRNERRKPRVGWAGAQQHQGDLEFILPVVEATANEVDWIFMGMCPPKLRYHVAEVHQAVIFEEYPAALAGLDLDLAIAPLEINRFNTAKSNLRLLEYGAVGYPVIATDILPYRNAPVTRVPNNPKAWIDAIRTHIHELDASRAAGEQLHEWVLSGWMLDQHLLEWMQALLPD